MNAQKKYAVVESRNGKFWTFSEGSKKWYTLFHDGETAPHPRAMWCETQREAMKADDGSANVAFGI